VPAFQDLPRAILIAISTLSGDEHRDVDGEELLAELARMGHEPSNVALGNVMFALRDDGGYVSWSRGGDGDFFLIRLRERGRQEVQGWPREAGVSAADVERLFSVLQARADDPDVPETERGRASAALGALRDLGVEVTGSVFSAWLKSQGIPG
jgi:hypothetical protein